MRKSISIAGLALAVTACTVAEPPEARMDREAALSAELRDYEQTGPAVSCVNTRDLQGNRSVGEDFILFSGSGGRLWVNRPDNGCPDLNNGRALITNTTMTRLCSGDIATVADLSIGTQYGGCGLGEFTPYRRRAR